MTNITADDLKTLAEANMIFRLFVYTQDAGWVFGWVYKWKDCYYKDIRQAPTESWV